MNSWHKSKLWSLWFHTILSHVSEACQQHLKWNLYSTAGLQCSRKWACPCWPLPNFRRKRCGPYLGRFLSKIFHKIFEHCCTTAVFEGEWKQIWLLAHSNPTSWVQVSKSVESRPSMSPASKEHFQNCLFDLGNEYAFSLASSSSYTQNTRLACSSKLMARHLRRTKKLLQQQRQQQQSWQGSSCSLVWLLLLLLQQRARCKLK
jgi:hypothetical protein